MLQKTEVLEIRGPFAVTLNGTREVKTFEAGWLARIENNQLVVGVEHSTYNGPFLEPRSVYALGVWAKVERVDAIKEGRH